ncbi:MAG: hypothetical protein JWN48_4898 [Myxococcaceae bacterium]|nr:hypothetical protein [Myxococcaceae bacterium]
MRATVEAEANAAIAMRLAAAVVLLVAVIAVIVVVVAVAFLTTAIAVSAVSMIEGVSVTSTGIAATDMALATVVLQRFLGRFVGVVAATDSSAAVARLAAPQARGRVVEAFVGTAACDSARAERQDQAHQQSVFAHRVSFVEKQTSMRGEGASAVYGRALRAPWTASAKNAGNEKVVRHAKDLRKSGQSTRTRR